MEELAELPGPQGTRSRGDVPALHSWRLMGQGGMGRV